MNNDAKFPSLAEPSVDPWVDTIICGDCLQILRQLPDACIDLILTDPPYGIHYKDRQGCAIYNDDNTRWVFPAFAEMYRVLKPNAYCVSFYAWSKAARFLSAWKECGFSPVGHFVWAKRYASCTRHTKMKHEQAYLLAKGKPALPEFPPDEVLAWKYTGNVLHPTQKPVGSLTPIIEAYCPPNGIVLDPFAGSGSTGAAARQCGRQFILIEKVTAYYRAAQSRLFPDNPEPFK